MRGLVAIAFAILAWTRPGPTLAFLIVLFGVYALADGILAIIGAMRAASRETSGWPLAIEGIFGIALGLFVLSRPMAAASVAFLFVAFWALCTGFLEIVEAASLRFGGQFWLGLSGLVRIAFGVLLFLRPGVGVMALLWYAAVYALIDGIVLVVLAFRLRHSMHEPRHVTPHGMTPQPV